MLGIRQGLWIISLLLGAESLRAETSTPPSWFTPRHEPAGPNSVYWRPLVSLFLPGFDQYLNGQTQSGLVYTSLFLGTSVWAADRADRLQKDRDRLQLDTWSDSQKGDYESHEDLPREASLSAQYTTAVGAMSAWHSFRTAVETQKSLGRYQFLKNEETPLDLLLAPFDFSYLERPTSWIPLLMAGAIGALNAQSLPNEYQHDPYSSSDASYALAFSYNAGVYEEALFRGYLQPVLYESWGSPFWSNAMQSLVFGLAHLGNVERPFAQMGMGYYLGWLQVRNDWTLGEGIFVHAWWDVIALSSLYLVRLKDHERRPPPVLWLPRFTLNF